jgi:hypothetical protein
MAIVPFPGTDWTNDERAEIRWSEKVCDASEDWSLECSHTDAGDPWCVVYDRHQERIILHIARIDRQSCWFGRASNAPRRLQTWR